MENQILGKDSFFLCLLCIVIFCIKISNTCGCFAFGSKGINEQFYIHGTSERCRENYSALPIVPPQAERGKVVTMSLLL